MYYIIENIVGQLNYLSIKYGNDFIFTNDKSIDIMFSLNNETNVFKISSVCIKGCDASINDLIACSCDKTYTFNELANIIVNCKLTLKSIDDDCGITDQNIDYGKLNDCITRFNEITTNTSEAIERDKYLYEIATNVYDWMNKYWRYCGVIVYDNNYKPFCYIYKSMIDGKIAFKIGTIQNSIMNIDKVLSIFPAFPISCNGHDAIITLKENFIKIVVDNGFMVMPSINIPEDNSIFVNYKRLLIYMLYHRHHPCVIAKDRNMSIRVEKYNRDFLHIPEYDNSFKVMLMKYGMINHIINIDNFIVMIMENDMRFGEKY